MQNYKIEIEYEIDADTPEQAAHRLADCLDEGLLCRPVCDVTDEYSVVTRIDTEDSQEN